ncbi:MAG: TonB-dependent receptor domain-containing protein [Flavobacteriales bacterium]
MKVLLSSLLGLFSFFASAQSAITGLVVDDQKLPLEFVNVILQNASDSAMVKAAVTGSDGTFTIESIPSGDYFILFRQVGFPDAATAVFNYKEGQRFEVPELVMSTKGQDLKAVEVVYVKPLVEIKADKTIFNVEGTTNAAGLNALEVLRKAPGVTVDNNENIMVKGRGGIVIYIDGKLTPLDGDALKDMLKNMQSSNIESIEIITNPSAKFDAAGNAGIINIKLKKNKNLGTNGTLSLGYGVQKYGKYNTNLTLNRRTEKWNLYGMYGNNWGKNWSFQDFYRAQNGIQFDQSTTNVSDGLGHNFKTGADYFVNPKHTVGVMLTGNLGENIWSGNTRTDITDPSGQDRVLIAQSLNDGRRDNINANLNYHFKDTLGHDLVVDFDYGYFDHWTDSYQPNTYYNPAESFILYENNFKNNTATLIKLGTVKADYEQPFLKGKLGAGFKLSLVETDNDLDFFNVINGVDFVDSTRTNTFEYKENINAGYINYNRQIKKLSIQLGLRAEHTVSQGELIVTTTQAYENIDRNYINFFPSAALTYEVNGKNTLNLTYSRRIDRPSYQDLNPFEYRIDELSYRKGNVSLRPQLTHSMELTHTFMYMVNSSIGYGRTQDFFTEITDTTEVERSFISPQNLGFQEYFSFNLGTPIPIAKWWNGYLNANFTHLYNRANFSEDRTIDLRANSYSFYMQHSFTLSKAVGFEVSGWYSGPGIWGGTFVNDPMWSLDLGMKYVFMNERATLRMTYGDIFWASRWRGVSDFAGLYMDASGGWESRIFRVNLSFNLGNTQMKGRDRKTGIDDLKNRVK